ERPVRDGTARPRDAEDRDRVPGRRAGAGRHPAAVRLLLQGGGAGRRVGRRARRAVRDAGGHGAAHRLLHVPGDRPGVLRHAAGERASARPAGRHGGAAVGPGGVRGRRRLAGDRAAGPRARPVPGRGRGGGAPPRAGLAHAALGRACRRGHRRRLARLPAGGGPGRRAPPGLRPARRRGRAGLRLRRALRAPVPGRPARDRAGRRLDGPLPGRRAGERGERLDPRRRPAAPPGPDGAGAGLPLRRRRRAAAPRLPVERVVTGVPVLSLLTAAPFVGALLIMFTARRRPAAVRAIAVASTALSLALAVYVYAAYRPEAAGFQFRESYPLVPSLGVAIELGVDGFSVLVVLLNEVIIFAGAFASWTVRVRDQEFYALLLTLVTGVFGVFVALDLFVFFLFYELAVLPMYLLIGIWGASGQVPPRGPLGWAFRATGVGSKEYAAMKLTLYLLLGSAFILVGIFVL